MPGVGEVGKIDLTFGDTQDVIVDTIKAAVRAVRQRAAHDHPSPARSAGLPEHGGQSPQLAYPARVPSLADPQELASLDIAASAAVLPEALQPTDGV